MNRLNAVLKKILDKKAVLFIGAGISSIAGCYNWDEIIKELSKKAVKNQYLSAESFTSASLKNDQLIEYFGGLFEKNNSEKEFWDTLSEAIIEDDEKFQNKYAPFIKKIKQIKPFPKIVTTNIDDCFERAGQFKPSQVFWSENDLTFLNFKDDVIFHIHGYKLDIKSALWTRGKYINRYNNPKFKELLIEIFTNNSVIFLGSKFWQEDAISNIIMECKNKDSKNQHFALIPADGKEILDDASSPIKYLFNVNVIQYGKEDDFCSIFSKWVEDNFTQAEMEKSSEGASLANA